MSSLLFTKNSRRTKKFLFCTFLISQTWSKTFYYNYTRNKFTNYDVIKKLSGNIIIPNYITISNIGLRDKIVGVMLPQLSDAMGIMLLRQQMRTIPKSLIEVGKLEKSSHGTIMTQIVLPIVKPGIISTAIIFFINSWNEYVWPRLILKTDKNYTLSLALQLFVDSEAGSGMGICMAMCVLSMVIPLILFIIFQRQIMATYASSGIKG